MSKKRLSPDQVANELRGHSAFFPAPASSAPEEAAAPAIPTTVIPTNVEHHVEQQVFPRVVHPVVEPPAVPSTVPSIAPSIVSPVDPTIQRPVERTTERTKVRHSFDVFADQLLALRHLALSRETTTGTRVLLGDLVQEAIDVLIGRGSGETERRTHGPNRGPNE